MEASTVADLAAAAILVGAGALAAARPRGRARGLLLAATGAAWLLGGAFEALVFLHRGPLVSTCCRRTRARLTGRGRRSVVAAAHLTGAVEPLGASDVLTAVLCGAVVGTAGERWASSGGIERRTAASALAAAVLVCAALGAGVLGRAAGAGDSTVLAVYQTAIAIAAVGLAADVLVGRWAAAERRSRDHGRSSRFEAALAEAARLQADDRLGATLDALAIYDQGDYLPGARSRWADDRRRRLAELATDARSEAAELALAAERYEQAERLADEVLDIEPFRETAWRLTMRISNALGDDDGVLRAYHACGRALAEVGTSPSPSTHQLLERLRR